MRGGLIFAALLWVGCWGSDTGGTQDVALDSCDCASPGDPGLDTPGELAPADVADAADLPGELPPADVPPDGPCVAPVAYAEYLDVEITGFTGGSYPASGLLQGDGVVASKKYFVGDVKFGFTVTFLLDDGTTVGLSGALPLDYEVPVALGQRVHVYARQDAPWWTNRAFVVWDSQGNPLFFLVDAGTDGAMPFYDCGGVQACPTARMIAVDCPPEAAECGTRSYPKVELLAEGGLSNSETGALLAQGQTSTGPQGYRYVAVKSNRYSTMECVDYPDRWMSAFVGNPRAASQCTCLSGADCMPGEVCETTAHRCVPDRCGLAALNAAGASCKAGQTCDAFTGACRDADPTPVKPCIVDADCGAAGLNDCHHEFRTCTAANVCDVPLGGVCVKDFCAVVDCAGFCWSLLGACGQCAADCDCRKDASDRYCDRVGHKCFDCDSTKFTLGRENPAQFEFYEICLPMSGVDPTPDLRQVDPSITCGVGGTFAKCDVNSQQACHGDLAFVPGTKVISDAKWAQLCALSKLSYVIKLAGGHFVL